MKNTRAIQQAIPEEKVYDPTAPVYHEGDTVYLENQEYQITELRADTVQLLPSAWLTQSSGPKVGNGLRRCCARMPATRPITEFLPINPDTADQDLRDVLAHGLIGAPDKAEISELLRSGESNAEIAQWLSRAYPDIIETMELETGDTADYRTMTEGIELKCWMQTRSGWLCCSSAGMSRTHPARDVRPSAGWLWTGTGRTGC